MNKVVKVKWIEASRANGRLTKIDQANLTGLETVGFLLQDTENALVLCTSIVSRSVDNLLVIPKSSVLELNELHIKEDEEDLDGEHTQGTEHT